MVEINFEQARYNMIEQQIRPWDVLEQRILDLSNEVPREEYVPAQYRNLAFTDMEIPLGHGHSMMPPRLESRMLQSLNIQKDDKVLEVGTGSGYVTALLARLAGHVTSVEIVPEFKQQAEAKLAQQGITNVTLLEGDAANGWEGRYDVIVVTGSLPCDAGAFEQGLNIGGRLFAVLGEVPVMEAMLITRISEHEWRRENLFELLLEPLTNAPQPQRFSL